MSTRIPRLWRHGDPRHRMFLPDFWMKLVETPKKGYLRLPKNAAIFEVDPRSRADDVRLYLEKIYKLPVREVRTMNVMGEITWDYPRDPVNKRALWKEEDRKLAFVFFRKDFLAEYPELFANSEMSSESDEIEKKREYTERNTNLKNESFINKERAEVGDYLPV